MSTLLRNGVIYQPHQIIPKGDIWLENGRIKAISPTPIQDVDAHTDVVDIKGQIIAPGFIDLHIYGGGGAAVMDATPEAIKTILQTHAQYGTTGMLVSTVTAEIPLLWQALKAIDAAAQKSTDQTLGSKVLGVHLESCFLAPPKRGAHKLEWLQEPSIELFQQLQDASGGRIKLMTIAPELPGAAALIEYVWKQGVVASFGHSDADYDTTVAWIRKGMHICTHLFNAMNGFGHRAPGGAGAFLTESAAMVQLIPDGVHVHPAGLELAYQAKGADKICLVTDSLMVAGTDITEFYFFDRLAKATDRACFLPDGTLAGSRLTMNRAVQLFVESTSATLQEALHMASLNPAKAIGLDRQKGSLEVGKDADVLVMDHQLKVQMTFIEGSLVPKLH
jgi:N-acetylglucosamine-6-phosphate deacetylase